MKIIAPRLPSDLTVIKNLRHLIDQDETISSAVVTKVDLSDIKALAIMISESRLESVTANRATLEKLSLQDVLLMKSNFVAANLRETSWQRTVLDKVRASGAQLPESNFKDIVFRDCKLDIANFRFAKLKNVSFIDCNLDEADFYNAELRSVSFQNCQLRKTQFSAAKLFNADFRTSDIAEILGVDSLSGAIINSTQLISLAPLLAAHLKIIIED